MIPGKRWEVNVDRGVPGGGERSCGPVLPGGAGIQSGRDRPGSRQTTRLQSRPRLTGLPNINCRVKTISPQYPDSLGQWLPRRHLAQEVFNFEALERVWKTTLTREIESIRTTNFYEHPEIYRIGTLQCPTESEGQILSWM